MDRVNALKQKCNDTLNEKNRLQSETDQTSLRLIRAEKLTSGLSSEGNFVCQNFEQSIIIRNLHDLYAL